jgi:hypothetical protein
MNILTMSIGDLKIAAWDTAEAIRRNSEALSLLRQRIYEVEQEAASKSKPEKEVEKDD